MIKRHLIVLFGGALLAAPIATRAERTYRIGILAQDLQPGLLDSFRAGKRW
jgi:hypothetical protein